VKMRSFEKVIFDNAEAKNCVGSSDDRAPTRGGRIELWERETNRSRKKCSFLGCSNDAEVGGHINIKGRPRNEIYIAAICYSCNNSQLEYTGLKKNTACVEIID
ncbi:hypothetical protein BpHYR1_033016, partial [Brachionus plicatilis]